MPTRGLLDFPDFPSVDYVRPKDDRIAGYPINPDEVGVAHSPTLSQLPQPHSAGPATGWKQLSNAHGDCRENAT